MSERREWWIDYNSVAAEYPNCDLVRVYEIPRDDAIHVREVLPGDNDKRAEPYIRLCEHEILKVQHAKLAEAATFAETLLNDVIKSSRQGEPIEIGVIEMARNAIVKGTEQ